MEGRAPRVIEEEDEESRTKERILDSGKARSPIAGHGVFPNCQKAGSLRGIVGLKNLRHHINQSAYVRWTKVRRAARGPPVCLRAKR